MQVEKGKRVERLQVMLSAEEIEAIDLWRYENMIPTRAAAVRELLRRGLNSVEAGDPVPNASSDDYGVLPDTEERA